MKMNGFFYLFALALLILACWLSASFFWGTLSLDRLMVLAIVALLLVATLAFAARRVPYGVWIAAGLLILAGQFLPDSILVDIFSDFQSELQSEPFGTPLAFTLFLMLSMALVVVALLLYSGLDLHQAWQNAGVGDAGGSSAQARHAGRVAVVVFVFGALLLANTLHSLYWLTVWDNTYDSLGYLWLMVPGVAVLFSGVMLSITLPGKTKLAGLLYALLIPALMIAVSARAQRVDFRQLTEARAERVRQVIETYYAREGRYPRELRQLTPWYVPALPGPVIIYGQDWCYEGGDDYYRLGYVYREHWSDPRLSGRIYRRKGEVPDLGGLCEEEVIAIQERYPNYPYEYWVGRE